MFKYIFDLLYKRAEYVPPEERTAIVIGVLFVLIHLMLDLLFFCVFTITSLPIMAALNAISIVISLINIYIFTNTKFKDFGLTLMIYNTCFYIAFSTFLMGYDKNANVLLPLMILITFNFYAKKPGLLSINLGAILISYCFNLYVKYDVTSIYQEVTAYADYVNNMFAILGTVCFIYANSKIEEYAKSYTDMQIQNLSAEANIDFLTGLKNRRYMENFLKDLPSQSDAYLVIADIDYFKEVNDTYGHECGDYVLKETSKLLNNSFESNDATCRWGGEEFLIFVKNVPHVQIEDKLNDLRIQIEKNEFLYGDLGVHITITFGYTMINYNHSIDKNIRNADIALYYGKRSGRNKVINFDAIREK